MSAIPDLERIVFFPGELLTSDDLTALNQNNQELRWLHNRTLHNWGIAVGLDVAGSRGQTSVQVSTGYAIDADGHEIILSSGLTKAIPAVAGGSGGSAATYYLVANYVDDANETTTGQRGSTACSPGGAVRLSNDPAILWKTATQLNVGVDVVLGQASIQNCVLASNVSAAARRYANGGPTFTIVAGAISAKDIVWKAWTQGAAHIGFTVAIDASAGNFQSTPRYVAQLVGERTLTNPSLVAADFVSIAHESPAGFTLQVALPPFSGGVNPASLTDPVTGPQLLAQLGWRITWMAIEG